MRLYAIIGEKLSHSLSPEIHNHILKHLNIPSNYCIIEIPRDNLPKAIDALKTLNYAGINVTIPYKESIMDFLDEQSKEAETIGAVNTIKFLSGKAIGYNTDYFGFGSMLQRNKVSVLDQDIVLFGCGGAAKAVITYLHDHGAKTITVVSKTTAHLTALKDQYPYVLIENIKNYQPEPCDIAINTTPVGMYPNTEAAVIGRDFIKNYGTCVDIVYNPLKTQFLSMAEELGKKTVDGLYMLIDQAIKAQEIFQNQSIDQSIGTTIYQDLSKRF